MSSPPAPLHGTKAGDTGGVLGNSKYAPRKSPLGDRAEVLENFRNKGEGSRAFFPSCREGSPSRRATEEELSPPLGRKTGVFHEISAPPLSRRACRSS